MITIIKRKKKFEFDNSELSSMDVVYDGIFVRFVDQTELKFGMSCKPGLSAVISIVGRCQKNVTVNLDEAEMGNLSKVVVIGDSAPVSAPNVKSVDTVREPPKVTAKDISKSLLDLYKK